MRKYSRAAFKDISHGIERQLWRTNSEERCDQNHAADVEKR